MELAPRGKSVHRGYFQDPARFRKALGDEVFEAIRYFESAVEVIADPNDEKKAPKLVHRFVLLSEAVLFVLDVGKKEASRDLWNGQGAHLPILLKDILQVRPLAKRSEVFAEDEINKTVRHFQVLHQVTDAKGARSKISIELAAWESGSLLLDQIQSAWINILIRVCLRMEISIGAGEEESKSQIFEVYQDAVLDITTHKLNEPSQLLLTIRELAESLLHDRELKRLFFTMPALLQHLLGELQNAQLPPGSLQKLRQRVAIARGDAAPDASAEAARGPSAGAVWSSRTAQLEYVEAILHLIHCAAFNSQTVLERSNLLTPAPYTLAELLEIVCIQFDPRAVERAMHRLEYAAAKAERVERRRGERVAGDALRGRSVGSASRPSTPYSSAAEMLGKSSTQAPQRRGEGEGEDEDEDEEFEYTLEDEEEEEGATAGAFDAEADEDDLENHTAAAQSKSRSSHSEVGSRAWSVSQGSNSTLRAARAGSEPDLLRLINERQVAILVELDDFVSLAVTQGRSRAVVSETLASQLSKTGPRFACFALPKFVKQLVRLIESWDPRGEGERSKRDWGGLAVRIYQHAKLVRALVLGSYQMLGYLLDNCEEELRYYLFKQSFVSVLATLPRKSRRLVQMSVLNRTAIAMLGEVREAVLDLQSRRTAEIKERSVLIM